MKVPIYSLKGTEKKSITVSAFSKNVRTDLIKKAVQSELAAKRQAYGTDPTAGMKSSAHYHGRRGIKHSMMNREMARMKRIHGSGYLHMRARIVPQATKGRKAHPPKAEKIWEKKVNKKERVAALLSAASATFNKEWVEKRGYNLEFVKHIPLVIENSLQDVKTIKDFMQVIDNIGITEELDRLGKRKIRSGKGTMRGRKYKKNRGMLLIVGNDNGIVKAVRNISGLEIIEIENLSVEMLAPGTEPGRLCIWTQGAVEKLEELA